jgi:hypothetical protein
LSRCAPCTSSTPCRRERFDRLTRIAAALFEAPPISTVTLIDEDRQWHKACVGDAGTVAAITAR